MSEYLDTDDHERVDAFDLDREVRRLRIAAEARRIIDAERRGAAEPFDAGTLAEILDRPAEPPMRIEDLAPWEAGVLLVAQRKTGKTTLSANYARALLTGEDFLGRFGVRPLAGDLAVLNFEVAGAQLARWMHDVGVPADRCHLVNLRGRRNPLSHTEDRARLAELLRQRGIEALIVDPFGRAYDRASQNDAGEVGGWLVDLDRFARSEVGATDLLLTAHAGWNGERTRGSSALEDWADTVWTMTRDPEAEGDDGHRYFRAEGRDVDLAEDRLSFDPDARRLTLSGAGGRRADRHQRKLDDLAVIALDLIGKTPGMNTAQIEAALKEAGANFQKGTPAKALTQLVLDGRLVLTHGPRNSKHYELPRTTPNPPEGALPNHPDPPKGVGVVRGVDQGPNHPACQGCGEPLDDIDGTGRHPGCEAGR